MNGKDGLPGKPSHVDGLQGTPGVQGPQGKDGFDGTPSKSSQMWRSSMTYFFSFQFLRVLGIFCENSLSAAGSSMFQSFGVYADHLFLAGFIPGPRGLKGRTGLPGARGARGAPGENGWFMFQRKNCAAARIADFDSSLQAQAHMHLLGSCRLKISRRMLKSMLCFEFSLCVGLLCPVPLVQGWCGSMLGLH